MKSNTANELKIVELRNSLLFNFNYFEEQGFLRQITINRFFYINKFFNIINELNEFIYLTQKNNILDTELSYFVVNFFAHVSKKLLVPESGYGWKLYTNLDQVESQILYSILKEMVLAFFKKKPASKGLLDNIIANKWPEIEIVNFKN